MLRPCSVILIAILAGQVAHRPAGAQERGVLIQGVFRDGRQDERLAAGLGRMLRQHGLSPLRVQLLPAEATCAEPWCWRQLASRRELERADFLLNAAVHRYAARNYALTVWLYDVRTGRSDRRHDLCERCAGDELPGPLGDSAVRLVRQLDMPAGPPQARTPRRMTVLRKGWIGLGVLSVTALITGAVLFGIHDVPACDLPDGRRNCPTILELAPAGASLIGVGMAGLVGASILLSLDYGLR